MRLPWMFYGASPLDSPFHTSWKAGRLVSRACEVASRVFSCGGLSLPICTVGQWREAGDAGERSLSEALPLWGGGGRRLRSPSETGCYFSRGSPPSWFPWEGSGDVACRTRLFWSVIVPRVIQSVFLAPAWRMLHPGGPIGSVCDPADGGGPWSRVRDSREAAAGQRRSRPRGRPLRASRRRRRMRPVLPLGHDARPLPVRGRRTGAAPSDCREVPDTGKGRLSTCDRSGRGSGGGWGRAAAAPAPRVPGGRLLRGLGTRAASAASDPPPCGGAALDALARPGGRPPLGAPGPPTPSCTSPASPI